MIMKAVQGQQYANAKIKQPVLMQHCNKPTRSCNKVETAVT